MGLCGRAERRQWVRSARAMSIACGVVASIAWSGAAGADPLPFVGSLSILVGSFGVGIPGQGIADVDAYGHLGAWDLAASAFRADGLVVPVTTSAAAPVGGIQVTAHNAPGHFERQSGGAMAIAGAAKVCVFGPCSNAVANLVVPLSVVGVGGAATVEGAINVTVVGAPWTTGIASVDGVTAAGWARGPGSQTSSTAHASGEIQLVTPIRILTNLPNDLAAIPAFGVLTLHFVPEPTTIALLGGGLVATAALGRRTRRRD